MALRDDATQRLGALGSRNVHVKCIEHTDAGGTSFVTAFSCSVQGTFPRVRGSAATCTLVPFDPFRPSHDRHRSQSLSLEDADRFHDTTEGRDRSCLGFEPKGDPVLGSDGVQLVSLECGLDPPD